MTIHPRAGQPALPEMLVNLPRLMTAYYEMSPDPSLPTQRVAFGTSGHRGSAFTASFNEAHILAIAQAICHYRTGQATDGPLFLGMDTHALSEPALASVIEVLAANGVTVLLAESDEYTPTPVISHAILRYNRGRSHGLADGIVITPSHNPPHDGGIKYNTPNGGPADTRTTTWIQDRANEMLVTSLSGVQRMTLANALTATTTRRYDFIGTYIADLKDIVDMDAIRQATLRLGVDPLGGAGVHYWHRIAERYGLNLSVVNDAVDPTFRFMTVDWDGQIRMDPSSPYAMQHLIGMKDRFDLSFACDTDHDRHGIVTASAGLLPPNHFLCAAIDFLLRHRPSWPASAAVGKTVVSSQLIDRVTTASGRTLLEVPVGFKWFVDGLSTGSLGFAGEESAGATFLRQSGQVWTTDKDGFVPALLAAEMTATLHRDPGEVYRDLTHDLGNPVYNRIDAPATPDQKALLAHLSASNVTSTHLAGDAITSVQTQAPGNGAAIGGIKVQTGQSWFAARPSGTENIYKIYAESFRGSDHLRLLVEEAQGLVTAALATAPTTG